MSRIQFFLTAAIAFGSSTAMAGKDKTPTPYAQVRAAIDMMETLDVEINRSIERRRSGSRGRAIECMEEQQSAIRSLLDLTRAERVELVEAMADDDQEAMAASYQSVMLWQVKAKAVEDKFSGCPTQREYDVAKAIAEAEALGRD